MKKLNGIQTVLREEPVFFSRLGFCYDPPIVGDDGKPVVFSRDFEKYVRYHRDMLNSGVKIHNFILHSGWVGVEKYDYSLCDEVLDAFFSSCGDGALLIPRIKLNVPPSWCTENPEDTLVYFNGPRTGEEIKALCETERQDWLGYPSPHGYYQAGDYEDKRPNVNSLIGLQSFSSKKWLEDAGKALKRLLEHLENGKYADKIIGYHIAYGRCGETVMFGEYGGDYGINQLRNFYDFALEKYGSNDMLEEAWGMKVSRDSVPLPSPERRYTEFNDICDFYRSKKEDRICNDYDEFLSYSNAVATEHFAKIIKENTGKGVGVFYGYYLYNSFSQYAGHLALDRILDSPYIDYIASPGSYYRRGTGDSGGEMLPIASVRRKKLYMGEIDVRSYLCENDDFADAKCFEDTESALWREVARSVSSDNGFWFMDLGGGWYDSDKMHGLVKNITENAKKTAKKEHRSVADVLFLSSEKGLEHCKISDDIMRNVQDLFADARQMGFLYDSYRFGDLKDLDVQNYKLVVIAYACELDSEDVKLLREKIKTPIAFFGGVGMIRDGEAAVKNISELTGINVDYEKMQLFVSDKDAKTLREENGKVTVAEKEVLGQKRTVCFAERFFELENIAREQGCGIYAPQGVTVYGDNRFTGFFNGKNAVEITVQNSVISGETEDKIKELGYRIEKNGI